MLSLYNTLTRTKEKFKPLKKTVTLYSCGPTVYHDAHIGNHRTFLTSDLLKRTLLFLKYPIKHIMNITDVGHLVSDDDSGEDKIELGARREGTTAKEIARRYEKIFRADYRALNMIPPFKWTRATEHIKEQIALIKKLEKKGFTYRTHDGIYFDSTKFKDYGKLAGLKSMKLLAGKRVAIGEKKHVIDFALWKFAAPGVARQMEWDSPWGIGFPGWHIECSAMAMEYLGPTIDIHVGGVDHIPVHHTNEIAQSEAATGKPFARYWVHGAFLLENDEKMSKSKGDIKTVAWLTSQNFSPLDFRYLTLQTHYRKELSLSAESLQGARAARLQLVNFVATAPKRGSVARDYIEKFTAAISDDLNAPQALAVLWGVMNSSLSNADKRATMLMMDDVLGLDLKHAHIAKIVIPVAVKKLVDARAVARAAKDWKASDQLRAEIRTHGFDVKDTPQGQQLEPVL